MKPSASILLGLLLGCAPRPAEPPPPPPPKATPTATPTAAGSEPKIAADAPPPSAPATVDPPAPKRPPPDTKAIARAVDDAMRLAAKCRLEPPFRGRPLPVRITISPNGTLRGEVQAINTSRPDDDFEELWAKPQGTCVAEQFEVQHVPPFDGEDIVMSRRLTTR
jgi:hypothetical protein